MSSIQVHVFLRYSLDTVFNKNTIYAAAWVEVTVHAIARCDQKITASHSGRTLAKETEGEVITVRDSKPS